MFHHKVMTNIIFFVLLYSGLQMYVYLFEIILRELLRSGEEEASLPMETKEMLNDVIGYLNNSPKQTKEERIAEGFS